MTENQFPPRSATTHPVMVIVLTLLTAFVGFALIGPLIGFLTALPFYEGSLLELTEAIQNPLAHESLKTPLFIMQGAATFIGLIVGPALMLFVLRRSVMDFFRNQRLDFTPILLTILIVIVFMGANSFFIEWNEKIIFPEFMKGFQEWARTKEDYAREVTTFLTKFDSTAQFLFAFFVIAILPAIGEELVFRGLIQNELIKATKNVHVSIWVAAFIFSAIHAQFFGFVPRLLLGALFGYLYYWSGNLTLSMLAHFVNNGIAVVGIYFYQRGAVTFDVESPEAFPWQYIVMSAFFTALLVYYFKKYHDEKNVSTQG